MNKPLISRWYIRITLAVLIIAAAWLVIKSFNTGREEGKREQTRKEVKVQ